MRSATLSVGIACALIISQTNNVLCFSPSPSRVMSKKGSHNKINPIQRTSSELFVLEGCFDAMAGSLLIAGSELVDASRATMDDNAMMMTPGYAVLDSDPAVSIALGIMFVTLLTLISIGPAEIEELKTGDVEQEDMVAAQATKMDRISPRDLAPEEVANPSTDNLGPAENLPSDVPQKHDIPLEVGAILKAFQDGDDNLFQRALELLVGRIQSTTAELNETKRLLRLVQEEKQVLDDKYDLRIYQLAKAEEKLKQLRSVDRQ